MFRIAHMIRFALNVICVLVWFNVPLLVQTAYAQSLIRDAEVEHILRDITRPLLAAAGLTQHSVKLVVLNDKQANAFVFDHKHIVINAGLILRLPKVEHIQAVIAHEIAHIANGHLISHRASARAANRLSSLGLALSAAIAASTNNAQLGTGLAIGGASAASRGHLSHSRTQEKIADQFAVRYMHTIGVSSQYLIEAINTINKGHVRSTAKHDHASTHPFPKERIRAISGFSTAIPLETAHNTPSAPYERMRAKVFAFMNNPKYVLSQIKSTDDSDIAHLKQAIAYHRLNNLSAASNHINALLTRHPDDPYYHELRGQIMFESRQFKTALNAYKKAFLRAPFEPLIAARYARALLALHSKAYDQKALAILQNAYARDQQDPSLLRDLAIAYARNQQPSLSSLITAEYYFAIGDRNTAAIHAQRAYDHLSAGSPDWLRAQDIVNLTKTN